MGINSFDGYSSGSENRVLRIEEKGQAKVVEKERLRPFFITFPRRSAVPGGHPQGPEFRYTLNDRPLE